MERRRTAASEMIGAHGLGLDRAHPPEPMLPLAPFAGRGWTWDDGTVGVQIMLHHPDAREVRRTEEAGGPALRLLNSYRHEPAKDDGLLLCFGGLSIPTIRLGIEHLISAAAGAHRAGGSGAPHRWHRAYREPVL